MKFSSKELEEHLVIIDCGENGVGSGFLAQDLTGTYVYTNQHVVFGSSKFTMTKLDGTRLKPKAFEYAQNRDIIRFKVDTPGGL